MTASASGTAQVVAQSPGPAAARAGGQAAHSQDSPFLSPRQEAYSSPMMHSMIIPLSTLSRRVPELRETDDKTMDFIKNQQRIAFVETIGMTTAHSHIKQVVRDYAHGLLAVAAI